jgi:hypothetical protein
MAADTLAQFIRQIDAGNRLGAGALAEKIVEWMATQAPAPEHGPSLPSGWRVQRNEDGSIGLFAPPPVDGESRRTSELFTGKLGSDMNEIVFKLLTHMLDATQAPAAGPDDARDAARYRFIRDADRSDEALDCGSLMELAMESMDAAIDEAMAREAASKPPVQGSV